MSTVRRHTRLCLDAGFHRVHSAGLSQPRLALIDHLRAIVGARSNLMQQPARRDGGFDQLDALRNLAQLGGAMIRAPAAWAGAHGHPLAVIDSLARHLFAKYPTPRFLASA